MSARQRSNNRSLLELRRVVASPDSSFAMWFASLTVDATTGLIKWFSGRDLEPSGAEARTVFGDRRYGWSRAL